MANLGDLSANAYDDSARLQMSNNGADTHDWNHMISSSVTVGGNPSKERVMLVTRDNFRYVGSAMSDPVTGDWEIKHISQQYDGVDLIVIVLDDDEVYDAAVADYVQLATPPG